MAETTKLSLKLRALAERKPLHADRLNRQAADLDRAARSLGPNLTRDSGSYRNARRAYCDVTGRQWDWGAAHDLDRVKV